MARAPANQYGLTDRQEAFIQEYVLNGGNGTAAALVAGYAEKSAHSRATENLKLPHVQLRMETLCRELMSKHAPACISALKDLAVSAASDTVRQAAASSLLDRTGYKAPVLLEVSDHRTQADVDAELSALLGLQLDENQKEKDTQPEIHPELH